MGGAQVLWQASHGQGLILWQASHAQSVDSLAGEPGNAGSAHSSRLGLLLSRNKKAYPYSSLASRLNGKTGPGAEL
jgi:hypothetical protein